MKRRFIVVCGLCLIALAVGLSTWNTMSRKSESKTSVFWGVDASGQTGSSAKAYNLFRSKIGHSPQIFAWQSDWDQSFPKRWCKTLLNQGAIPLIFWEPWVPIDREAITLDVIASGQWDDYISEWAKSLASIEYPVLVSLAPQFNTPEFPWGVEKNKKSPEKYIAAYRHVVDIFRREGAHNAVWVWSGQASAFPKRHWNSWSAVYPGDAYVDWIGISATNKGTQSAWTRWQSLESILTEALAEIRSHFPDKPVMITRLASTSVGGDQSQWFKSIPSFLQSSLQDIKAIVFGFEEVGDYRLSEASEKSLSLVLENPLFEGDIDGFGSVKATVSAQRKYTMSSTVQPPVIDGNLAEWQDVALGEILGLSSITQGADRWKGPSDLSAEFRLFWNREGVFFSANVTDDQPFKNRHDTSTIEFGDSIELFIEIPTSNGNLEKTVLHAGLSPGDGALVKASFWDWSRMTKLDSNFVGVQAKEGGYSLEAFVPWQYLSLDGDEIESLYFSIGINDFDQGKARETQMVFNRDGTFRQKNMRLDQLVVPILSDSK